MSERQIGWLLAGMGAAVFAMLLALEIVTDEDPITILDIVSDGMGLLLMVAGGIGIAVLLHRVRRQDAERAALISDLRLARKEGEAWRAKVQANLRGIRSEMEKQFAEWGMTAAERDVGLLILKGLSHKEIAALRDTAEATVRQQAQSIYQKSQLPGKTAFSGYFLEDLFAPAEFTPDVTVGETT